MFLFHLKRTTKLAAKSLWMHKLRSMLTMLGIIFGVASVIAMLSIGEGASREIQERIARFGSRNIIIETVKPPEEETSSARGSSQTEYGLTYDDAERFQYTVPNIEVIVPARSISQQAWYRNRKAAVEIIGTVPWFTELANMEMLAGRFLSSFDLRQKQGVCVVDEQLLDSIFAPDNPMNKDIKIAGDYYQVIGIVKSSQSQFKTSAEEDALAQLDGKNTTTGIVYIPLTTAKSRFGEIAIQISSSGGQAEKVQLNRITVKVDSIENVLITRDVLTRIMERFHKKKDYEIVVPLEVLREVAKTKQIFSIVLGSIAAISLLVGGIGIMNIMLATVSERTREIGIRRALGARERDIISQFLTETVLLTLTGGIIGIVLGIVIPFAITHFAEMPAIITPSSLILAFCISATVGITFGLYPAYRAANMDPIESLRHE